METRRLTKIALLASVALIIFVIEAQIPPLVPIPGVKLGLANVITLYAMFTMGPKDALWILLVRILLGSMFAGQVMSLIYSLSGGLLCYLLVVILHRLVGEQQVWVCGIMGAIAHNIGQMIAAIMVTKTIALLSYLPVLLLSGMICGLFTGYGAQYLLQRQQVNRKATTHHLSLMEGE